MPGQIFRTDPPTTILEEFIREYGLEKGNYHTFSNASFKKARLELKIEPFCSILEPFYFSSKKFYVTRKKTYKSFITIIRQLCKHHHIPFTSTIKYSKSSYEMVYSIFIPEQ